MCDKDESYQGYSNRETWAVALHINNDQGWQEQVLDLLRDMRQDSTDNGDDFTAHNAGAHIREIVEEIFESVQEEPDMRSRDLIMIVREVGSLWRVNWTELGASFLEDIGDE